MTELDLDTLLKAAGSPEVGKNADSLFGMLQEANKLLGEMDKMLGFVKKLESSILVSTAVRVKAKEKGISLEPLHSGIVPPTDAHKQVCENICKLNADQLNELLKAIATYDAKGEIKK